MREELLKRLCTVSDEEKSLLQGEKIERIKYFSGKSNIIDSAKVLESNAPVSMRLHTRFADFPEHSHNYIEIVYMCKGKTTHIINGDRRITLKEGEFLMLNQHAKHRILRAGYDDIAVNFIILPYFFDEALKNTDSGMFIDFMVNGLKTENNGVSYLHFAVSDSILLQNTAETLILSFLENKGGKVIKSAVELMLMLLTDNGNKMEYDNKTPSLSRIAAAAIYLIDTDYRTAALCDVARKNCVSEAYVSKAVKSTTGKTFKELLMEKRLAKAKEYLIKTDLSVRDICVAVGYDNTSHFYRIFEKSFGCTPLMLRNREKVK